MIDTLTSALNRNHLTNHRGQCHGGRLSPIELQVLRPFYRSEALSIAEAADIANKSPRTIRGGATFMI